MKSPIILNLEKSNNLILDIKSNYILQKLIGILSKKKLLDIIKYNKYTQGRIKININDYKEYSETCSSIEIEVKPFKDGYNEFININFDERPYYHIYFNNNKEDIKMNYLNYNEKVDKIKIIIDYQVKSFEGLFNKCKCIEYIYFKKFYRKNINNMFGVFFGCSFLKELNLSNFKTNNVIDMGCMFYGC